MEPSGQTGPSDARLVTAALDGDRESFGLLVSRHRELLLTMCHRALGQSGAAEDAAQEAVLEAMVNLDRLRKPQSFGAWLAGIGLNVCRRWLRQPGESSWSWEAIQGGRFAGRAPTEPSPEETAEVAQMTERVRRAVGELPAGQRAAVALYYLAGLNQEEVAAALGIRVGAVKGRLHKARTRLRERLWSTWKEEVMGSGDSGWIDMEVSDVRRAPAEGDVRDRFVVLLEERNTDRGLPIWVGQHEGTAIAMLLERTEMPRPMTFHFLFTMLEAVGSRLSEVLINRLAEGTFYAEAVIDGPDGRAVVDARPSDAIALSLLSSAPIRVGQEVMNEVEREGVGSRSRFENERDRYVDGAGEIVQRTRRDWEIRLEQLRSR